MKDYCFILQPKADHQGSKRSFRDFHWIGPYLVETVPTDNKHIVRKLKTNKTQILHRIRLRKYNPEKPPDNNYQEAQWQIDDNIAWDVEFGGHLFELPILYTDPNAIVFDESYTQGPDIVPVPRSFFLMIQLKVKIGKLDPLLTHLYFNFQSLNRTVTLNTLRPLQT